MANEPLIPLEDILATVHKDLENFTDFNNKNYIAQIIAQQDFNEEPKLFLYTVLYKLNNGLKSSRHFLNFSQETLPEMDSLFLILRTLISDSLMTVYVIKKDYSDNESIANNIRRLYTDHLKYGLQSLRRYGPKFWNYTKQQVCQEEDKIKKAPKCGAIKVPAEFTNRSSMG